MTTKTPSEIARETLLQLIAHKLAPTPANYQTTYNEIAGITAAHEFPVEPLRELAYALPTHTPFQQRQKIAFEQAIAESCWESTRQALLAFATPEERNNEKTLEPRDNESARELREQVARLIESALPALGSDDTRFAHRASELITSLRDPAIDHDVLKTKLKEFGHRLTFAAEDQAEIRSTLLKLLHLLISHLGDTNLLGDGWLKHQLDALSAAAIPPLTLRRLDALERQLADVMRKQVDAKDRTLQVQNEMRRMLAAFIERLAQTTDSTSAYHTSMEQSARQLADAKTIEEISPLLDHLINATRNIAAEIAATRDELREMRTRAQTFETEIAKLHQELNAAAAQARHDALTGALNRNGLNDVLHRELADVHRKQTALCVALLDIDNFKKLNDNKGHEVGDAALRHLATVTRETIRAQDTLVRYGGEEFVILMPDTTLESGVAAMVRLQRILTRKYFMSGDERLLITFSAGVAQLEPDETPESAIKRADQAMYLAKRAGKNRVFSA